MIGSTGGPSTHLSAFCHLGMSHFEADLDGKKNKCFQCPENFDRAGDLCYSIKTIQEMSVQREGIVF